MSEHDDRFSDEPGPRAAVVKRRRRVFSGFLNVDEALVNHSRYDGTSQDVVRLSLERGDSVAIALVDRSRRVVFLAEQFRFPTLQNGPGWLREIPAGDVKRHETPAAAAIRETFEETGFTPTALEAVTTVYASPGASSERIAIFFVAVDGLPRDAAAATAARDAGEDIAIIEQPLDSFLDGCRAGSVLDAKTLIAGLWLLAHRERLAL